MEFKDFKDIAELIYYLSWPIILLGIGAAWLQLKAFNKESTTRFKRESIVTSIEILERKLGQIAVTFCDAFEYPGYSKSPKPNSPMTGYSSIHNVLDQNWLDWYHHNNQTDFYNNITECMNHFETLSQYVFSGVADEEMCYKFEHALVLKYLDDLMPYIIESRVDDEDPLYEGIVHLHQTWTARLLHDKSQKDLARAVNMANSQVSPQPNPVLGVKK